MSSKLIVGAFYLNPFWDLGLVTFLGLSLSVWKGYLKHLLENGNEYQLMLTWDLDFKGLSSKLWHESVRQNFIHSFKNFFS